MLKNSALVITTLKTTALAHAECGFVPYNQRVLLYLNYLQRYRFIKLYRIHKDINKIAVYPEPNSLHYIKKLQLYSKSSYRRYTKFDELIKIARRTHFGLISTTRGIIPIQYAILYGVGGEILFLTV